MHGIWRLSVAVLLLAELSAPVHADLVSATFGGMWVACGPCPDTLGVIHSGDFFSGAATWDTSGTGALQAFDFVMPPAEGLTVGSISDPRLASVSVFSPDSTPTGLDFRIQSAADNFIYRFAIEIPAHFEGAFVDSLSSPDLATYTGEPYFTTGPTPVPEPSTIWFLGDGLALMGLIGMARKRPFKKPAVFGSLRCHLLGADRRGRAERVSASPGEFHKSGHSVGEVGLDGERLRTRLTSGR